MRARRAIVDHAVLGGLYIVCGLIAFVVAVTGTDPEFGTFAAVMAAVFAVTAVLLIAVAVRGMREVEPLPEAATVSPWFFVAVRQGLSVALPVATIVFVSTLPFAQGWVVGLGCVLLGAVACGTAGLAARTERRRGGRLHRIDNRYFLAH